MGLNVPATRSGWVIGTICPAPGTLSRVTCGNRAAKGRMQRLDHGGLSAPSTSSTGTVMPSSPPGRKQSGRIVQQYRVLRRDMVDAVQ